MALPDLPRCVQHPVRAAILVTLLDARTVWTFPLMRDELSLTDGNLNRHLKVLVDAGWVRSRRSGRGRGSSTTLEIAAEGRRGLETLRIWCGEVARALDRAGGSKEPVVTGGDADRPVGPISLVDDHSRSWQQ
jgi:DNA-binding transcriptional ArsR family regulator